MQQLGIELAAQVEQALDRIDIRTQGQVQRREELDQARAIEHEADPAGQLARLVRREPGEACRGIPRQDVDALSQGLPAGFLHQRLQGRRVQDLLLEPVLGGQVGARPHQHVDPLHLREAVQQQR